MRVSARNPYCLAAAELGSSGFPDSVYPSPLSATFLGKGLPWRHILMNHFCAWDVNARWSRVPTCSAHFFQSRPCSASASRKSFSSSSVHGRAFWRTAPVSLRFLRPDAESASPSSPVGGGGLGAFGALGGLGSFGGLGAALGFAFFFFFLGRP